MEAVHAGPRLDRLPIGRFHYRTLGLVAGGMFLDAFEIYLQGAVLAALLTAGWSTPGQNATFVSATFAGMVIGSWLAGIAGDRFGRRFSYQANLLVFGLASLAASAAPSMSWLTALRFVMGLGLGAEIVVGYVTISELVPPAGRGRWGSALAVITNSALFFSALIARVVIPAYGWRWMFVIVGIGALVIWQLRKNMPESPRWLEAKGRLREADAVLRTIEDEAVRDTGRPLPPPASDAMPGRTGPTALRTLFAPGMLSRTLTGSLILVALNTAIYGFIAFLPSFMVRQGISITASLTYVMLMSLGGPVGALIGLALSDRWGRKPCILVFSALAILFGALYPSFTDPNLVMACGFLLVTATYVLVAIAWSLYVPELFPTGIRMRGAGFCNTAGRVAGIVTPQLVVLLYAAAGVAGVIAYVSLLLALQIVVVAIFGIETKGRPLEAIAGDVSPA